MEVSFLERKTYKIYEMFCLQSEKGLIISSRFNPDMFKFNDYHLQKFKDHGNQSFRIFAEAIVADATVQINVNLAFSPFISCFFIASYCLVTSQSSFYVVSQHSVEQRFQPRYQESKVNIELIFTSFSTEIRLLFSPQNRYLRNMAVHTWTAVSWVAVDILIRILLVEEVPRTNRNEIKSNFN